MKYLATIKFGSDSHTQSFDKLKEAEEWLNSQNNNMEHTTYIRIVDNLWNVIDEYEYTKVNNNH